MLFWLIIGLNSVWEAQQRVLTYCKICYSGIYLLQWCIFVTVVYISICYFNICKVSNNHCKTYVKCSLPRHFPNFAIIFVQHKSRFEKLLMCVHYVNENVDWWMQLFRVLCCKSVFGEGVAQLSDFSSYYRPRTEYDWRLCFYRCLSVNTGRGYPGQVPMGGGDTPRYLSPPPAKVPTLPPDQVQTGGGGTPRYLTPPPTKVPTPTIQVQIGGRGYPKVPTPQPGPDRRYCTPRYLTTSQGTYPPPRPRYLPPPPPPRDMEYLIRRGRYASCVHAGGLSCLVTCFWHFVL